MDDKPLSNTSVLFVPEQGRPSGARTDASGKYELIYNDSKKGAVPGKYRIRISTKADASQDADGKPVPASPETIPLEYNDQTKLEFTVEEGKTNIADFKLKSGGKVAKNVGY